MPMMKKKKFRGLRRYFKLLTDRKLKIPEVWIKDGYFCFDKLYVDDYGLLKLKARKPHIDCLMRNYEEITKYLKSENEPFQLWVIVYEWEGRDDCIYLHSKNPFEEFPYKYKHFSKTGNFKNTSLMKHLESYNEFERIFSEFYQENDKGTLSKMNVCILYKAGIGMPII